MFAQLFTTIHTSLDIKKLSTFSGKLTKCIKVLLTIGCRLVFEVVIVWTVINANQSRNKQRTIDFGYVLGIMNIVIILLTIIEALFVNNSKGVVIIDSKK